MVESTVTGGDSDGETTHLGALTPSQILYLQQGDQRLYVQLIQILRDRNMGWLRPLCLCNPVAVCPATTSASQAIVPLAKTAQNVHPISYISCDGITFKLQDMRHSADLLWPLSQCQTVLDMEAIPILAGLGPDPIPWEERDNARQSLNLFMKKMWHGTTSH